MGSISRTISEASYSEEELPVKTPRKFLATSVMKTVCLLSGIVFVLTTIGNLIFTIFALQTGLTRISQINFGYQIIFLMPFLPFVFGVTLENRELLVPFFIVNVYSTIFNILVTIFINLHIIDIGQLDSFTISALSVCSAVVSTICGIFIVMLFHRFTTLQSAKQTTDDEFKINNYSLLRYGDIVQ